MPLGQPAAMGGDERGAGGAAARQGFPDAALPDAQPDPPAVAHRRDPDIGALGEQLVVFEKGAEPAQIDRIGIADKERRVRVADAGTDRVRQVAHGEIDAQRIHFAGERDVAPPGARRPHIDGDPQVRQQFGVEQPGQRLEPHPRAPGFLGDQPGDAAGTVAARLGFAAVGVDDAHERLRRRIARLLDHDQLVAADPLMAVGQRPGHRAIDPDVRAAPVDDDKIVAEPVHLAEGDPAGRDGPRGGDGVHGAAYMAARRIISNRHVQPAC